jgi:hypothetical protein
MNKAIIRIVGMVNGEPTEFDSRYITDVDFKNKIIKHTGEPWKAKIFDDKPAAMEFWKTVDPDEPLRPWDGQPNRPLTCFTVEVIDICVFP